MSTSIQWTDETWNPVRGCSVISPGCVNCYAMKQAHRFSGAGKPYEGLTKLTTAGPQWTGVVRTVEDALLEPLSWKKPRRVFVNSMSDLFHESVPDEFIDKVFAVMALAKRHTFQILTKRAERMREYCSRLPNKGCNQFVSFKGYGSTSVLWGHMDLQPWPLPNVWLGVSVESEPYLWRVDRLMETPAAVRFISAEPLIAPIDFGFDTHGFQRERRRGRGNVDWVIVGGESGPGARPFDLAWARSIIEQCRAAGVACFVKQIGSCIAWPPLGVDEGFINLTFRHSRTDDAPYGYQLCDRKGGDPTEWPEDLRVRDFPGVCQ